MKITAGRLKEARENKKVSLREVSTITKINIKVLERIEDADLDALPPSPFLKGFLRTYAKFLDLDADEILQIFSEETTPVKKELFEEPPEAKRESSLKLKVNLANLSKKALLASVVVLLCFSVYGLVKLIKHYENEGSVPVETTEVSAPKTNAEKVLDEVLAAKNESDQKAQQEEQQPVPAKPVVAETIVEEPAVASPAEQTVAQTEVTTQQAKKEVTKETAQQTTATEDTAAKKPELPPTVDNMRPNKETYMIQKIPSLVRSIFIESIKVPDKKPQPKAVAETQPAAETTEPETQESVEEPVKAVSSQQELIVESIDKTSFSISVDGKGKRRINLPADSIYVIKAQQNISVSFNDAGSVSIAHNGKYIGVPGEFGQRKDMRFP